MKQLKTIKGKFIVIVPHDGSNWTVAGSADYSDNPCSIIEEWYLENGLEPADYEVHIMDLEIPVVNTPRFGKPKCKPAKE